jgi:hypothetical protein
VIRTSIPYEKLTQDKSILKYYDEVIDKIWQVSKNVCEIRMKHGVHSTKNMRKHTIVQWLILDIVTKAKVLEDCAEF